MWLDLKIVFSPSPSICLVLVQAGDLWKQIDDWGKDYYLL